MDMVDPNLMKSKTLIQEPRRAKPNTLKLEPQRTNDRTDTELPMCRKSNTDNAFASPDCPIFTRPCTEQELPSFIIPRNDIEEPRFWASNNVNTDPILENDRSENALPM